jgi:hypothetical protein
MATDYDTVGENKGTSGHRSFGCNSFQIAIRDTPSISMKTEPPAEIDECHPVQNPKSRIRFCLEMAQ